MNRISPGALLAFVFLGLIGGLTVFADFFSPGDARAEFRRQPYHPPTPLYAEWKGSMPRLYVYATESFFDENQRRVYREKRERRFYVQFFDGRLFRAEEPARILLMGTDSRGRDLFSRILAGGRVSLAVGLAGALLTVLLGFTAGSIAGYFGGRTDFVLMRLSEFFMMVPAFYFLLAVRGALPAGLNSLQIYGLTAASLSLIGWGGAARVVRGLARSIAQSDFITAARMLGSSHVRILIGHIFPHTFSYLAVVLSVSIPGYILMESALSLLGLGVQEPDISWGNLLSEAVSVPHLSLHPWVLYPGFVLAAVSFAFNRAGDSLQKLVRA
ncbi:MAG: ABC transporter permease [Candidatus Omnitrophica bacterium]|nr:ABC transporter permease [Candidatus Omnitrophota bacterium]